MHSLKAGPSRSQLNLYRIEPKKNNEGTQLAKTQDRHVTVKRVTAS